MEITDLENKYDNLKVHAPFDPKAIRSGIASYFSSNLYDYSIYSYFYNINMFLIKNPQKKSDAIVPFKDKNLSHILQDKNICECFYQNNDITKHINSVLSQPENIIFSKYFIEVTFPTIYGHFISDDLCERGFVFLEGFYELAITSENYSLYIGLLSKFIRSDMNFQFCMFDSFNSLYSIDAKNTHGQYIICLDKSACYSFSLLNSKRTSALKKLLDKEEILKEVVIDIIKKVIITWKYDSFNMCYEDVNYSYTTTKEYNEIACKVVEVIKNTSDDQYQTNEIGLLFPEKKILPIVLTYIDLIIIDKIFNEAEIDPIYYQNQAHFDFNINQAFAFAVHYRAFFHNDNPFKYGLGAEKAFMTPKRINYFTIREKCISNGQDPIEQQKIIKDKMIADIKSNKNWASSRIANEIDQVNSNYKFALSLEIKICQQNEQFQKKLNAYSNRVFKSYFLGINRYMSQIIHKICLNLSQNITITNNNNNSDEFKEPVLEIISKELKRFFESVSPINNNQVIDELVKSTKERNNYKTEEFFLFIQKEFYKKLNLKDIIPLDNLTENSPLMNILTELRQSLFFTLEGKFNYKDKSDYSDLKNMKNVNDAELPNINFIKLMIDNASVNHNDALPHIFTFIEIFNLIKNYSKDFKSFIIEYFSEINKSGHEKAVIFMNHLSKSKAYYQKIYDQIPSNFTDVFNHM